MKKLLAFAVLAGAAACSMDSPTQPTPLVVPPQLGTTTVGGSATWYFTATIYDSSDPTLNGLDVTGSVAFTVLTGDQDPDDCHGLYVLDSSVSAIDYEVDGSSNTLTGGPISVAEASTACFEFGQAIAVTMGNETNDLVGQLALPNPGPGETDDFPLEPPSPGATSVFAVFPPFDPSAPPDPNAFYLFARVNSVSTEPPAGNDPATKDDCKKGGWSDYGFRNQGQCVRFIETGKDSR